MSNQSLTTLDLQDASKVKVAVTDIDGILRGKYLHPDKFRSANESGFGFCNVVLGWDCSDVCYDNASYTGWHTGYPDVTVHLAPETLRRIPWENNLPFVLGEFVDGHAKPLEICPRQLLKRVVAKGEALGFEPRVGCEFEWFNFKETPQSIHAKGFQHLEPLTPGMFGYSILRSTTNGPFFNALFDDLNAFRVPLEGLHTETGPGVYEGAIMVAPAMEAADRAVLFKTAVKEIAQRFGILATFMARWNDKLPGCGGHMHQSLWRDGANVFHDQGRPNGMSQILEHYLAGMLHCMPDIMPMFAPTVNSYKRLVEGFWAPTRVTWGVDNRTVAVRYIPGSPKSTRLEFRVSGADVNPYLGVAAAVASGLYGIEHKLLLNVQPTVGSAYASAKDAVRLPRNLLEATEKFQKSELARSLFGAAFVEHFAASRDWEWRQSQASVTEWELRRYLEII